MPPEQQLQNQQQPIPALPSSGGHLKLIGIFVLVCALGVGGFYAYLQYLSKDQATQANQYTDEVRNIVALQGQGDYAAASQKMQELQTVVAQAEATGSESGLTPKQEAIINQRSLVQYKASGEQEDALEYIRNLKKNIMNPELSAEVRAENLSRLAFTYCSFGRDPETLAEIFKGEPFSKYWVDSDSALSARRLLEWAYNEISPSARTAAQIGRWYINRALIRPLDAETEAQYIDLTKKYLGEAETLDVQEIQKRGTKYTNTRQYAGYLYWRAFIINGLVAKGDTTYTVEDARKAYSELRDTILAQNNASSQQLLPYSHVLEAKFIMVIEKDEAKAKEHLAEAIRLVRADPYVETNELAEFARDSWGQQWGGYVVTAIKDMAELDPTFKKFIEEEVLPNKIQKS